MMQFFKSTTCVDNNSGNKPATKKKKQSKKPGQRQAEPIAVQSTENPAPSRPSGSDSKTAHNLVTVEDRKISVEKIVPNAAEVRKEVIQDGPGNEKVDEGNKDKTDSVLHEKSKAELKAERRALQEARRAAEAMSSVTSNRGGDDATAAGKSKSELRAERRATQEAQRAAKGIGIAKTATVNKHSSKPDEGGKNLILKPVETKLIVKSNDVIAAKMKVKQIKLFSHLPPYKRDVSVLQAVRDDIHPAIIQLGIKYAEDIICGSNARCLALIDAFQQVIRDFRTPRDKEISHALPEMILDPSMNFLEKCRPVSVVMKNVAKKLREEILNLDAKLTDDNAKEHLDDVLCTFRKDSIEKAHEAIVKLAIDKITSNDVILTYGSSHVVRQILVAAHRTSKFSVIVVDSRPKLEGRKMFEYLIREKIECSYFLINALSYAMREATKVLLGAHALLANGYVMSRIGSSQVALVAKAYNKPVMVCCETYKFCELVQTDSFVVNELGDPEDLVRTNGTTNPLSSWTEVPNLNVLNPYYDVTPPDLVTVVVNDVCLVPCTSVPVLLRVRPTKK